MEIQKLFHTTLILGLTLLCVACAQPEQQTSEPNQTILKQLEKGCSASPPVLDSPKLRLMLVNNGRITNDMTEDQIKQTVNAYINQKIKSIRNCKKP